MDPKVVWWEEKKNAKLFYKEWFGID